MRPLKRSTAIFAIPLLFSLSSCRAFNGDSVDSSQVSCTASSTSTRAGDEVGIQKISLGSGAIAQSFQPVATISSATQVSILLKLVAPTGLSLTGLLYVTILSDKNGSPDGGNVLAYGDINVAQIKSGSYDIEFEKPLSLTADTTYWIRVDANYTASDSLYIAWLGSNANPYSRGKTKVYNRQVWTSSLVSDNRDLAFRIGCL